MLLQDVSNNFPPYLGEMPSFSLGLTQEEHNEIVASRIHNPLLPDTNVGDNMDEPQPSRTSKRQKMVPSALLTDYECGPHMLSRLRQTQKLVFLRYRSV